MRIEISKELIVKLNQAASETKSSYLLRVDQLLFNRSEVSSGLKHLKIKLIIFSLSNLSLLLGRLFLQNSRLESRILHLGRSTLADPIFALRTLPNIEFSKSSVKFVVESPLLKM